MKDRLPQTKEEWRKDIEARKERHKQEQLDRDERIKKEAARQTWIANGGAEENFEKAYPEMRRERQTSQMQSAEEAARARQSEVIRSSF